jgi:hypothetical protein
MTCPGCRALHGPRRPIDNRPNPHIDTRQPLLHAILRPLLHPALRLAIPSIQPPIPPTHIPPPNHHLPRIHIPAPIIPTPAPHRRRIQLDRPASPPGLMLRRTQARALPAVHRAVGVACCAMVFSFQLVQPDPAVIRAVGVAVRTV